MEKLHPSVQRVVDAIKYNGKFDQETIEEIQRTAERQLYNKVWLSWCIDDVMGMVEPDDCMTEAKAQAILFSARNNVDAEHGMNWSLLGYYAQEEGFRVIEGYI